MPGLQKSAPLQKAEAKAKTIAERLYAYAEGFNRTVIVLHEEGTSFIYRHAFLVKDGKWYYVFPEHHDLNVFHEEDLNGIMVFGPPLEPLTYKEALKETAEGAERYLRATMEAEAERAKKATKAKKKKK